MSLATAGVLLPGTIRSFDPRFLAKPPRLDIAGAWRHVNGTFLLAPLLGIATSICSLARLWLRFLLVIAGFFLVWQIHARWGHGEAA